MQFTELSLCDTLLEGLQAMNFKETTPVQELAIPVILEKKDVIACAQTGTGKTAAFLLPLLNNLQTDAHEENKINAIIMAPTRELAQQIDQQMEGFSYFTPFSSVAVYGGNDGEAWDVQKRGLLSGADVVISTPGRLLSHINLYNIDFSGVKYFILDEADRMLDMGFHEDIMKIEKLLPKNRQTVMFSATMPPKIQQLAKSILRDPAEITIAISRPPESILQSAYICYEAQKINIVKHLFKEKAPNKVILFSGSKQKVKEIAKILIQMGLSAGEMHSDLDQSQRNHVMHEFKNERINILVATDIVSRGIDIDDITLVINFDVPYDAEDYVHRIGRTARAGDSGMAITFVSPDEQYRFSKIEQFLGKQIYRIPVPAELGETPEYNPVRDNRRGSKASNRHSKENKKGTDPEKRDAKSAKNSQKLTDSDKKGKSERAERIDKKDNPENVQNTERAQKIGRPEKKERSERTNKSQEPLKKEQSLSEKNTTKNVESRHKRSSSKNSSTNQSKRSDISEEKLLEGQASKEQANRKKNSRNKRRNESQKQDVSSEHRLPVEERESGGRNSSDRPRQSGERKKLGGQRQTGELRSSDEQKSSQNNHNRRSQRDFNTSGNENNKKRTVSRNQANETTGTSSQKPNAKPEQGAINDKPKRWSWWPFGKKNK